MPRCGKHATSWCGVCGKWVYRSKRAAKLAVHAMLKRGDATDKAAYRLNAYRCRHGPGWHVGHSRWLPSKPAKRKPSRLGGDANLPTANK